LPVYTIENIALLSQPEKIDLKRILLSTDGNSQLIFKENIYSGR